MSDLTDLRVSLEDLTHAQLLERISEIRESRKISKNAITLKAARTRKTKDSTMRKIKLMIGDLTLAEIEAIVRQVENKE